MTPSELRSNIKTIFSYYQMNALSTVLDPDTDLNIINAISFLNSVMSDLSIEDIAENRIPEDKRLFASYAIMCSTLALHNIANKNNMNVKLDL
jgi:hypothetical protein